MSTVWSSQVAVLATTIAVSGTMVLLLLCRDKATFTENATGNQESGGRTGHAKTGVVLRSCLSSGKKDGRVVKKVRFSEDVKDSSEKNDAYRKAQMEVMMHDHVSYGTQPISLNGGLVNKNLTMLVEFSN